ncbi:MAG: HAMP domain-containing protein [Rhodobacteraceae bacterium]|nr:HAMP domain-containing protein [Paracoccaceae bacterium]
MRSAALSLRQRLMLQLLVIAAVLAVLLYLTVRTVAGRAAEATQDGILGAATIAIAEQLRGSEAGVSVDIPYSAFSILGSISEDRIFYRIDVAGQTLTGYDDLPLPPKPPQGQAPVYYTSDYKQAEVRISAVSRPVLVANRVEPVLVMVGQTRLGQAAIAAQVAKVAAGLGIGFFAIALVLSLVSARSVLRPIDLLAAAVGRRGPRDLRSVEHPTPKELRPLVVSLNGFIARLRAALSRTETFIAEAAHHIRTPLATVRTQTEIALRQSEDEATRRTLRAVIRAVEESSRSAGQLLDHATVIYRAERLADEALDLAGVVRGVTEALRPTAELKDIALRLDAPGPVPVRGDRMLLESAVRNLLDNAVKYSPDDSEIGIAVRAEGARATLRVQDRGRGLGGKAKADLAERFHRGGNVADVVGSGLGLTIVEEVATAHGGSFDLSDREGGGTCALFTLPLR